MTDQIYEIFDQAWKYREASHYGELLVAAYSLWTLLRYDFGVTEPPYDQMLADDEAKEAKENQEFIF